ncbi:MAG TPA: hypothetical protein VLE53_19195 [Gemmatimonadaceae bacterium]|nr:hypothetical protein [Gemmatimonadaceae bacterium]
MRSLWTLIALATMAAPAGSQDTSTPAQTSVLAAILNLPQAAEAARRAGIPAGVISDVLDSLRRRKVPADDAEKILRDEVEAVDAGAPRENFGAYVNAQLARGLRGRELAAAIHAEHARRGIGRGRGPAAGRPGRAGAADTGRARGRGRGRSS